MQFLEPIFTSMSTLEFARKIASAYGRLYLYFYRRRDPRGYRPSPEAMAVMEHLAATGPLTVTEAAGHLDRSQSSVSELLDRLVKRGHLTRISDERDRRRTLVWLSKAGIELLETERQVFDINRLERALALMTGDERDSLISGLEALLTAAQRAADESTPQKKGENNERYP